MIDFTNAIDVDGIELSFIKLITGALGILAIKAEQSDAPFPEVEQIATVHFLASQTTGQPSPKYTTAGNDLTETITTVKRATISVNFYRETDGNAIQFADIFRDYLWSEQAKSELRRSNIGTIQTSDVRNLSEVEKTKWESRAQIDVEVYAINEIATTTLGVDTIDIEGTVEDVEEIYDVTVNVSQ